MSLRKVFEKTKIPRIMKFHLATDFYDKIDAFSFSVFGMTYRDSNKTTRILYAAIRCSMSRQYCKVERPSALFKVSRYIFFVISMYPFFTYFWHLEITDEILKKFSGSLHFALLSFLQYINNYLGLSNSYIYAQYLNNYLGHILYFSNYLNVF